MVNFREYITSSGLCVLGGKSAESNDALVNCARSKDVMLHTNAPGSPFVNVGENPSKKDIKEAAVFCAKYSQDWRDGRKDVIVNKFLRRDMSKSPTMKDGSWSVGKHSKIKVSKNDILFLELTLNNDKGK